MGNDLGMPHRATAYMVTSIIGLTLTIPGPPPAFSLKPHDRVTARLVDVLIVLAHGAVCAGARVGAVWADGHAFGARLLKFITHAYISNAIASLMHADFDALFDAAGRIKESANKEAVMVSSYEILKARAQFKAKMALIIKNTPAK